MTVEDRPPDLRMVPLAVAAWGGSWLGTAGASLGFDATRPLLVPLAIGLGVAAAIGALAWRRRSIASATVVVVLLLGLVIGWLHLQRLTSGPVAALAADHAVVEAEVVVAADARVQDGTAGSARPGYVTVRTRLVEVGGRGGRWRLDVPVLLIGTGPGLRAWQAVPVGTRLVVIGRLEPPDPGSDIAAVLRARTPGRQVGPPGPGLQIVERVRQGLRESVSTRPPEPRALVPALVVGDTSAITPELQQDFRQTGLTHLTAVSGANLTLLLAFVLALARWSGVRGWWLRIVGLLGVVVFVALCRAEPSVLRAAAMGLVALAALGTGGRRRGMRHLAVAVTALTLIDPFLARSLGFALSVLASAGIVWWSQRWTAALTRWLPGPIAEAVAVPLAASLATVAVVAGISEQVSVSGLLANALAGPAVGPATVLGFAAAGLSLVSPTLAGWAGFGASLCAQLIIGVAHAGAAFPGAAWRWPAEAPALAVLAAAALVLAWLLPLVLARWWLSLLLAVIMVGGLLSGPVQPGWPPRGWALVACDVGQGDGLVIGSSSGEAVLVDAGPDPSAIDRCLDQLRIRRLAVVVLTHFHADHVDGLSGALQGRQVGEILVSPFASPASEAVRVGNLAAGAGARVRAPVVGEHGQTGGASWTVLGPVRARADVSSVDGASPESAAENDASLVLRLTVQGLTVLLTGDVEPDGQARILASGADLTADVLKVPHHGSARQDPAFLAATHARVAVASAGLHNDYGHPAPRTVRLLQSLGMTVLRTDQQGSVAIVAGPDGLAAVSQR